MRTTGYAVTFCTSCVPERRFPPIEDQTRKGSSSTAERLRDLGTRFEIPSGRVLPRFNNIRGRFRTRRREKPGETCQHWFSRSRKPRPQSLAEATARTRPSEFATGPGRTRRGTSRLIAYRIATFPMPRQAEAAPGQMPERSHLAPKIAPPTRTLLSVGSITVYLPLLSSCNSFRRFVLHRVPPIAAYRTNSSSLGRSTICTRFD